MGRRYRRRAAAVRSDPAVDVEISERGVVAVRQGARLRERARSPHDPVRDRADPARTAVATDRKGSAGAEAPDVERLVGVSGAVPRSQALRADVLSRSAIK